VQCKNEEWHRQAKKVQKVWKQEAEAKAQNKKILKIMDQNVNN